MHNQKNISITNKTLYKGLWKIMIVKAIPNPFVVHTYTINNSFIFNMPVRCIIIANILTNKLYMMPWRHHSHRNSKTNKRCTHRSHLFPNRMTNTHI